MRHHNANRKLGRERGQRRALLKSLARSLVLKKSIKTTEAKAKELRPYVEKLITTGKKQSMSSRRSIEALIGVSAGKKVVSELSVGYKERNGGYLRIVKTKPRLSDGSPMAIIEFV